MAGADSETKPMNAEPLTPPEPRPDRYRWTRRSLKLAGCLVVLLAGLRWWWGYEANRRLQAEIAKYRAAGQLVYAREFDAQLDAVPDAENAAVLYEQAIDQLMLTAPSGASVGGFVGDLQLMDERLTEAIALLAANQTALQLAREARSRPECDWRSALNRPHGRLSPFDDDNPLADVLCFAAECNCLREHDAEAIEAVRDLLAYSAALESHPDTMSSSNGWQCEYLALECLERLVGRLRISDSPYEASDSQTAVTRRQLEAFIAFLLDEQPSQRATIASLLGERAVCLDALESRLAYVRGVEPNASGQRPSLWRRLRGFPLEPMATLDTLSGLQWFTVASRAVVEQTWAQAGAIQRSCSSPPTFVDRLSRPFVHWYRHTDPRWSVVSVRLLPSYFAHVTRRRLAATALAVYLFELMEGRRPLTLEELVPVYLPAVPADPFTSEGTPIRYRPSATPALVYSVGPDGKDNRGNRMEFDSSYIFVWHGGRPSTDGDITFRLWRRTSRTSPPGSSGDSGSP